MTILDVSKRTLTQEFLLLSINILEKRGFVLNGQVFYITKGVCMWSPKKEEKAKLNWLKSKKERYDQSEESDMLLGYLGGAAAGGATGATVGFIGGLQLVLC